MGRSSGAFSDHSIELYAVEQGCASGADRRQVLDGQAEAGVVGENTSQRLAGTAQLNPIPLWLGAFRARSIWCVRSGASVASFLSCVTGSSEGHGGSTE